MWVLSAPVLSGTDARSWAAPRAAERRRISFPLPRAAGRAFTHDELALLAPRITGTP
jgi:hypothetical protein